MGRSQRPITPRRHSERPEVPRQAVIEKARPQAALPNIYKADVMADGDMPSTDVVPHVIVVQHHQVFQTDHAVICAQTMQLHTRVTQLENFSIQTKGRRPCGIGESTTMSRS